MLGTPASGSGLARGGSGGARRDKEKFVRRKKRGGKAPAQQIPRQIGARGELTALIRGSWEEEEDRRWRHTDDAKDPLEIGPYGAKPVRFPSTGQRGVVPQFPYLKGGRIVRGKGLGGVKGVISAGGFIQNTCFSAPSELSGIFPAPMATSPAGKTFLLGPGRGDRQLVSILKALRPLRLSPVLPPPPFRPLEGRLPRGKAWPGSGMGAEGKGMWWVGFGELAEGGGVWQWSEELQEIGMGRRYLRQRSELLQKLVMETSHLQR